ncbi:MAG TPA: L,D-transpeptidase [Anaerolineales bacterium]|jgi:hypothetical protein|nr:L,D-transpeptidase [Anaerolineales bacterium]
MQTPRPLTDSIEQISPSPISRREFLRLGGLGFASALFPGFSRLTDQTVPLQGRVTEAKVVVFDRPSLIGNPVKTYWKDMILSVAEATVGDEEPDHNRIWYRIEGEGYVHSGGVQPVQTRLNQPDQDIPGEGALAEVTVPFTDAHWGPGKIFPFAYRFYYETTYWVTDLVEDERGSSWYRVQDDKWDLSFFAPATHLRLIPREELAPLSPLIHPEGKRLEVRLGEQLVVAYEWKRPVFMARAATGAVFSNGRFETPVGRHMTFHKRPTRHMAAGDLASNGYDLPGVPWISYITEKGVAIHGTYWHNDFGRPRSHGCINLTPGAAKWIYRWTLPPVPAKTQDVYENYGTQVDVVE